MIIFDTINILLLTVIFIYFCFLLLIFLKASFKKTTFYHIAVILTIILWTISKIYYRSSYGEVLTPRAICMYAAASFIASFFYLFSIVFPYESKIKFKNYLIAIGSNFLILLFIFWPGSLIEKVVSEPKGENTIIFGRFYIVFFLYFSGLFLFGLYNLWRSYNSETGRLKFQIRYVFWGYFLGSIFAMFTNLFLPWIGEFRYSWVGQIVSVVMVAFVTYAMVKHKLFNIKVTVKKSTVYIFAIVIVISFAIFLKMLFSIYFPYFYFYDDILILMLSMLLFSGLRPRFLKIANKYFFTSSYDSEKVVSRLSDQLRSDLTARKIYSYIVDTIKTTFHSKRAAIFIYNKDENIYKIVFNDNLALSNREWFLKDEYLSLIFSGREEPVVINNEKGTFFYKKHQKILDYLENKKIKLLFPLKIKNSIVGVVALGEKTSEDFYDKDDLRLLSVIGAQSAVAIDNSLKYEQARYFNVKLDWEVKKATKELREANEELKQLDQAKSDFISIASHQLRTPLTVVKGYISMMLEGNFGKLRKEIKEPLEKVYDSNERLVRLVEDLLHISRIESGRMMYKFQSYHMEKIVESVVDELNQKANKRGLEVELKRSDKLTPRVKIDTRKIRQVIMNLIDNAIKYTYMTSNKNPHIEVEYKKRRNYALFCVTDNGIGMNRADMTNLFKKFSRGKNTFVINTEGTGLGLYVSKQIIESHKGHIWAESKGEGKGSKFCFELPFLNEELMKDFENKKNY